MQITEFRKFRKYVEVDFNFRDKVNRIKTKESFKLSFERLDGESSYGGLMWSFPKFVTEQILNEIIKNTCFECGGLMKDGQALDNTWVSANDFGNDAGQRGTTLSKIGSPILKQVRKCTVCGHSHT